jgi:hypothetical protein
MPKSTIVRAGSSAAASLSSLKSPHLILAGPAPSVEFLSVPFILSYCIIAGVRLAFEIPSDLRANWIFRLWLSPDDHQARPIARRVLHAATLPWLIPLVFAVTLIFFSWIIAVLHAAFLTLANVAVIEILLMKYRKIPFTCSYPKFESHSGVILVAYLLGFFLIANYIPALEHWSLVNPVRAFCFIPVFTAVLAAVYLYRKQMLEMDKQLIFEEPFFSGF